MGCNQGEIRTNRMPFVNLTRYLLYEWASIFIFCMLNTYFHSQGSASYSVHNHLFYDRLFFKMDYIFIHAYILLTTSLTTGPELLS